MAVPHRILRWIRTALGARRREKNSSFINYQQLESVLTYTIRDYQLFSEALSHRSFLQVSGNETAMSNERLEFLGDSVLNLVVAEYLYRQYDTASEGELTKIRSRLVSRKALVIYARELQLGNFLLMGHNASQVVEKGMETILSDAYEALIGAIYLDSGYDEARRFVERTIRMALKHGTVKIEDENFKSLLLERAQAEGLGAPRYVTINEEGPDHDRTFTVEVYIGNASYGVGLGKNKKDAEQAAAEKALQKLNIN